MRVYLAIFVVIANAAFGSSAESHRQDVSAAEHDIHRLLACPKGECHTTLAELSLELLRFSPQYSGDAYWALLNKTSYGRRISCELVPLYLGVKAHSGTKNHPLTTDQLIILRAASFLTGREGKTRVLTATALLAGELAEAAIARGYKDDSVHGHVSLTKLRQYRSLVVSPFFHFASLNTSSSDFSDVIAVEVPAISAEERHFLFGDAPSPTEATVAQRLRLGLERLPNIVSDGAKACFMHKVAYDFAVITLLDFNGDDPTVVDDIIAINAGVLETYVSVVVRIFDNRRWSNEYLLTRRNQNEFVAQSVQGDVIVRERAAVLEKTLARSNAKIADDIIALFPGSAQRRFDELPHTIRSEFLLLVPESE